MIFKTSGKREREEGRKEGREVGVEREGKRKKKKGYSQSFKAMQWTNLSLIFGECSQVLQRKNFFQKTTSKIKYSMLFSIIPISASQHL